MTKMPGYEVDLPFAGPIERLAYIENSAAIGVWDTDAEIREYTTWQLQQLRRALRLLRRMGWRDCLIRADELHELSHLELHRRGAWTAAAPSR